MEDNSAIPGQFSRSLPSGILNTPGARLGRAATAEDESINAGEPVALFPNCYKQEDGRAREGRTDVMPNVRMRSNHACPMCNVSLGYIDIVTNPLSQHHCFPIHNHRCQRECATQQEQFEHLLYA